MRKSIGIALVVALVAVFSLSVASADDLVPGAYYQADQSLMSPRTSGPAFRTQMQIGASARLHTANVDLASGAGRSLSNAGSGGGEDFQWGQSQTEQSWKAARTVEEAQVHGLVPNDCQGENSDDVYRKQMGQTRSVSSLGDKFMNEPLVSNAQCGAYHPTLQ